MSSLFGKSRRSSKKLKSSSDEGIISIHSNSNTNDNIANKDATNLNSPNILTKDKKRKNSNRNQDEKQAITTFSDLKLAPPLLQTCRALGYRKPTPVQRTVIPFLLSNTHSHMLALAATGSGKTASFVLPILHNLSIDPYGIYAVVLTPTRELAKQIYEQVLALGSSLSVRAALTIGGMDMTRQSCDLSQKPHFCVATPGRLAALLRGPNPPVLRNVRYVVLDEADRLLASKSGFERDVAETLLHATTNAAVRTDTDKRNPTSKDMHLAGNVQKESRRRRVNCQTLLFSATLTRSLESLEEIAGAGLGRLPLQKFVLNDDDDDDDNNVNNEPNKKRNSQHQDDDDDIDDDDIDGTDCGDGTDTPKHEQSLETMASIPRIPAGLRQEYIFMPSHVRDAYLVTAVRTLMANGGRKGDAAATNDHSRDKYAHRKDASGWNDTAHHSDDDDDDNYNGNDNDENDVNEGKKARSAVIFVSTCERTALISGILSELGVSNVSLHSLLTQNRRLASLAKFKSQQVRVLIATDVASRGLDIPSVDLVLNSELPRRAVDYVHRVGRTARAGRRGRAVSLVGERDVALVHAAEKISGRAMEKCKEVTDDLAVQLLGAVTKASRITKMKLNDIGFDELVKKMKERKVRDRKERVRAEKAARKVLKKRKIAIDKA